MKRRGLAAMMVVLVALVVVAALQSRPQPAALVSAAETVELIKFLGLELDVAVLDIVAVRVRNPQTNEGFSISRDADGNWTAPDNPDKTLDVEAARNIATAVVTLQYRDTLSITDQTNLADFGFNANGGILSLEVLLNDQSSHVIAIGRIAPSEIGFYGLVDERDEIFLFERGAVDYLLTQLVKPPLT
ncbi:MAG: hypothetical protein JNJ61_10615 [Anaerolineae bacterium]|nr:hypothetical protein [Anaerolineae bacterium]